MPKRIVAKGVITTWVGEGMQFEVTDSAQKWFSAAEPIVVKDVGHLNSKFMSHVFGTFGKDLSGLKIELILYK